MAIEKEVLWFVLLGGGAAILLLLAVVSVLYLRIWGLEYEYDVSAFIPLGVCACPLSVHAC
jgi:hypothetical protein